MEEPVALSGIVFTTQQEVMREMVGEDVYERAIASLPPDLADTARTQIAVGWVSFDTVSAVVEVVGAEHGESLERFQRELVGRVARRQFRGVWRMLLRLTSREALLKRASALWRRTYSRGEARFESDGGQEGTLILSDLGYASDYMLRGVGYSFEALLEHTGATDVRVRSQRLGGGHARFEVSWHRR